MTSYLTSGELIRYAKMCKFYLLHYVIHTMNLLTEFKPIVQSQILTRVLRIDLDIFTVLCVGSSSTRCSMQYSKLLLIIVVSILYMIVDAPEQADGIDNCGLCSWDEQRSVSYPSKDHRSF